MIAFLIYILKSSFCLALLYGFYRLLFASTTRFSLNRWILTGGMLTCLLLPFISLELEHESLVQSPFMLMEEWQEEWEQPVGGISAAGTTEVSQEETGHCGWPVFLVVAYLSGCAFVLLQWMVGYIRLFRWINRQEYKEWNGWRWVLYDIPVRPFSWRRYIVMNRREYEEDSPVCLHEEMHCRYGHCYDNLLIQFVLIFHWWNPLVWKLKHELNDVHEYQADEGVLNQGIDAKTYQLLLVRKAVGSRLYSMACGFTHSSLKKRISMMSKKRNSKWVRLRVLLAVPLAAGVVYTFARPEMKKTVADYSAVLEMKNQGKKIPGLMTQDAEQRRDTDNLMLDYTSSEKAYVLELYCNQRNQFLFGPKNPVAKKEPVDWETMTDKARKQLTDAFVELYSKKKEKMLPIVVRIVADRNAKMEAITDAKQKLIKAYEVVRRELSETYPQELVDECLIPRFYYASPKAFADVPAGISDKGIPLPGYEIRFFVDNAEVGELKDFSLDELSSKIKQLCEENQSENFSVSLKIPSDASEGVVYDIKQILRKGYMLRLNLVQGLQN
ncbi:M56 family metallopeptidase [Phocaeicola barnesiae]|uniref:M56 family metallopeptidase n=1 Tax=Phocaeicola barnesiae TaxID=376804 RepID=UPI0025A42A17|nr:M56 family metallopeptidase [Phocaeicola barnesiae]MDM8257097.1 M56 family metallopeptidase [Phocaeicola barnesiae]